jgi:hypothetical protein
MPLVVARQPDAPGAEHLRGTRHPSANHMPTRSSGISSITSTLPRTRVDAPVRSSRRACLHGTPAALIDAVLTRTRRAAFDVQILTSLRGRISRVRCNALDAKRQRCALDSLAARALRSHARSDLCGLRRSRRLLARRRGTQPGGRRFDDWRAQHLHQRRDGVEPSRLYGTQRARSPRRRGYWQPMRCSSSATSSIQAVKPGGAL